jgi:TRAP-type transport system periplasmic protein
VHRRTVILVWAAAAALGSLALTPATVAAEEARLRVISAQPQQLTMVSRFLELIEKINADGKGVVQIEYAGGPETTPPPQQAVAIRTGVTDMQIGPAGYFLGTIPEADAIFGSNVTPMEARAKGGMELLNQVFQKKLNAYVLGHFGGGINFNIFVEEKPKPDAATGLRLDGMKLRSAPPYKALFESLGAVNVMIPVGEVYTGLERGVVDGLAFPSVGVLDFGWEKFLKYRIDPGFWQEDTLLLVNLDKWNSLSPEAQELLQNAAIAWEEESYKFFTEESARTTEELKKRGVEIIELTGAERDAYLANAYKQPWAGVEANVPESAAALRAIYFQN